MELNIMELASKAAGQGYAEAYDLQCKPRVAIVIMPTDDRLPCEVVRMALKDVDVGKDIPQLDPEDSIQQIAEQLILLGRDSVIFTVECFGPGDAVLGRSAVVLTVDSDLSGRMIRLMGQSSVPMTVID